MAAPFELRDGMITIRVSDSDVEGLLAHAANCVDRELQAGERVSAAQWVAGNVEDVSSPVAAFLATYYASIAAWRDVIASARAMDDPIEKRKALILIFARLHDLSELMRNVSREAR